MWGDEPPFGILKQNLNPPKNRQASRSRTSSSATKPHRMWCLHSDSQRPPLFFKSGTHPIARYAAADVEASLGLGNERASIRVCRGTREMVALGTSSWFARCGCPSIHPSSLDSWRPGTKKSGLGCFQRHGRERHSGSSLLQAEPHHWAVLGGVFF